MKILDRYIGRTVLTYTLVVLAVLLSIYFFSTLVDELDYVGTNRYTLPVALEYCIMLMPRQAYELFPMVALLGSMLGLGTLASSNELTVIRAAGVSVQRLTLAVMKMALLLMLAVAAVGEFAAPALEQQARIIRAEAISHNVSINTKEGLWARDGDTYVNIRLLLPAGLASDVSLYIFDDTRRLQETVHAEKAVYRNGGWMLEGVVRSDISAERVTTKVEDEERWETRLTPEVMNVAALPADKLAIWELIGYVVFTRSNGLDASTYELALWTRLASPFAVVGMMLLAVPFVFGSLRSVGIGVRVTVGGLLGIGFYMFNAVFGPFAIVYHIPPALSAVMPTLLVYALWGGMMRWAR